MPRPTFPVLTDDDGSGLTGTLINNAKVNEIKEYITKGLELKNLTELTINDSGVITITEAFHIVDTYEDAASDDLDTINGGTTGALLVLKAADGARTVVVKHNTGNIWLKGQADLSLDDAEDGLLLIYSGTKWIDLGAGGAAIAAFLELNDTPASYEGQAGKYPKVNAGEDALEFATPSAVAAAISLFEYDGFFWQTLFESLDGWTVILDGASTCTLSGSSVRFETEASTTRYVEVKKTPSSLIVAPTWDKNRRFKIKVKFENNTNQTIWLLTGASGNTRHIGFKITNNTIYGTVANGSAESTVSCGTFTAGTSFTLEAVFISGTSCEFFKNGVSQGTLDTNLPSGAPQADWIAYLLLMTDAVEAKVMFVYHLMLLQES